MMVGEGCEISPDAELRGPLVVGRDSSVESDAMIERSVLFDNCTIGEGARLQNSILSGGVTVEAGAELDGGVIGEKETVAAEEGASA
jgi:NDP-sugar pyrophosphorylase family protein